MKILITGGSGFLGSALTLRLTQMDHQIFLLMRKKTNLQRFKPSSSIKIGRCDSDVEICKFINEASPDVVIHTACCYGRNLETFVEIIDANIRYGALILNALKALEKKVTFINTSTILSKENNLYALTKNQFEELGTAIASTSKYDIQFINIKLQHMYGPGDDSSKFTSYVIDACKSNVPTLPLTLGRQKRDFIYLDDVVDAYICIIENLNKLKLNEKIELGSGFVHYLHEFVEIAHKLTNSKTKLLFGAVPYRDGESMNMIANIEGLKKLGWTPKFNISAGIKKILEVGEYT